MPLTDRLNSYNIRIARESDADKIYYLVQRAFSSYGDNGSNPVQNETIKDIYYDLTNSIILLIEYMGVITGSLRLCEMDNNNIYLKRFSINPDYQNMGMGTSLYYYAEKLLRKKFVKNIY